MLKSIVAYDSETHGFDLAWAELRSSTLVEYGRTKQFFDPAYKTPVPDDKVPNKSHLLRDKDGKPFVYLAMLGQQVWLTKATDKKPILKMSRVATTWKDWLPRLSWRLPTQESTRYHDRVRYITVPGQNGVEKEDVVIGYQITAPNGDIYAVFVKFDDKETWIHLEKTLPHLRKAEVIDENQAGPVGIQPPRSWMDWKKAWD